MTEVFAPCDSLSILHAGKATFAGHGSSLSHISLADRSMRVACAVGRSAQPSRFVTRARANELVGLQGIKLS